LQIIGDKIADIRDAHRDNMNDYIAAYVLAQPEMEKGRSPLV
jgi:hypothetical protein